MSSLDRPLAGPLLLFDLPTIAAELRSEESYLRSGRAGRTLAKAGRMRVVLVAIAEDSFIGTQQADSPLTIQVLEGDIDPRHDSPQRRTDMSVTAQRDHPAASAAVSR